LGHVEPCLAGRYARRPRWYLGLTAKSAKHPVTELRGHIRERSGAKRENGVFASGGKKKGV
jgi:hypothetical protein